MTGPARRFGVMLYPDQPFPVLTERLAWLEDLGFDQVFLPDHSGNLRQRGGLWFDSWAVLAMAALVTKRIRLGMLVANQVLRPPAQLAKQAITLDHMSGGRFELGVGTGVFPWDNHSVGEPAWPRKERVARFADYVEIVAGILRHQCEPFSYTGSRLWVRDVPVAPGPVSTPLTIGGQSPAVLAVAAKHADVWNTHGPPGASAEEVLAATAAQNRRLDRLTAARGPSAVRRAYTLFGPWDPRYGTCTFEEVFDRFGEAGITDFVLDWPEDTLRKEFERVARNVLPLLR